MYAIVDVETTGSYAAGNGITEIAICIHDGVKAVEWFESLVRPDRNIPMYITGLTGITNDMVAGAPTFEELLPRIEELTKGCIFVAHHAHFDYSFVKKGFEYYGLTFNRNKLCTVRLSRKLIPGLPSYSLGRLCRQLQIQHLNAHRAMGDVKATVKLFEILMGLDEEKYIQQVAKRNSGETILPAHLPRKKFDDLPQEPGVYYFKDGHGKIIYIGKAANIKQRVRSHFTGDDSSEKSEAFKRQIYDVSFRKTGSELVALLLEDSEIRKYWPKFNKAQKSPTRSFGIYRYEDLRGYIRLGINKAPAANGAVKTFSRMSDAKDALSRLVDEFGLCASLCGFGSFCEKCVSDHHSCGMDIDAVTYNSKVKEALDEFSVARKKCAIIGQGREDHEKSVVVIDGDRYLGFGFVKGKVDCSSFDEVSQCIDLYPESSTIRKILYKHLSVAPSENVIYF